MKGFFDPFQTNVLIQGSATTQKGELVQKNWDAWNADHAADSQKTSGQAVANTALKARSEYDEKRNTEITDHLKSLGFKANSANQDPKKDLVTYGSKVETPTGSGEALGATTHTVVVYPNGAWEHYSESTHEGTNLNDLKHISLTGRGPVKKEEKEFAVMAKKLAKENV